MPKRVVPNGLARSTDFFCQARLAIYPAMRPQVAAACSVAIANKQSSDARPSSRQPCQL
jgi:hypothetical protein